MFFSSHNCVPPTISHQAAEQQPPAVARSEANQILTAGLSTQSVPNESLSPGIFHLQTGMGCCKPRLRVEGLRLKSHEHFNLAGERLLGLTEKCVTFISQVTLALLVIRCLSRSRECTILGHICPERLECGLRRPRENWQRVRQHVSAGLGQFIGETKCTGKLK